MGFNYSIERKKFEREWKKIREEYLEAGMSESSIMQLYQFDLASFYSNRRYIMHIRHITVSELCDAAKISCSTIYNTMGARCTPRPLVAGHGCLEKNSSYFPKIKKDLKRKVSSLFHGGDKRDRTADLLTASQSLSQLSYTPEPEQLTV